MAHSDHNSDALPHVHVHDADGNEIQVIAVPAAGLTVGRRSQCEITLAHPKVSRQHLRIERDGHKVTLTDLASDNGSWLNEKRLPAQQPVPWERDQTLAIGPFRLILEPAAPPDTSGSESQQITEIKSQPPLHPPPTSAAKLRVFVDHEAIELVPGQPRVFSVTVGNDQEIVDQVRLELTGVAQEWIQGNEHPVALNPGTRRELPLTVTVPREPSSLAGSRRVTIWARSLARPGTAGTDAMTWTIAPFAETKLDIDRLLIRTRINATYQLKLGNRGNQGANYVLRAHDAEQILRYRLGQSTVQVPPGKTRTIELNVSAPRRWFGNDVARTVTVEAAAEDEEQPSRLTVQFVHQALLPAWVLPLLIVLLLLLLGWLAYQLGLRP